MLQFYFFDWWTHKHRKSVCLYWILIIMFLNFAEWQNIMITWVFTCYLPVHLSKLYTPASFIICHRYWHISLLYNRYTLSVCFFAKFSLHTLLDQRTDSRTGVTFTSMIVYIETFWPLNFQKFLILMAMLNWSLDSECKILIVNWFKFEVCGW